MEHMLILLVYSLTDATTDGVEGAEIAFCGVALRWCLLVGCSKSFFLDVFKENNGFYFIY